MSTSKTTSETRLLELESAFWESAGDSGFCRENFAEDGVMALPDGLMTKAQVLSAMEEATPWSRFTIDDLRFVDVGDDVTALVYTADAGRDGPDDGYRAAISSVYVNRGGNWRLVLHQQTPL
jgi:Domain of unknown function (DUF4440)